MSRKRKAKVKSFAELQQHWYAKLRKTGFVDIECGKDLNKMDGQTLRGAGPNSHVLWDFDRDQYANHELHGADVVSAIERLDETCSVWDTSKHEYFDRISHWAQNLPNQDSLMAKALTDLACGSSDSRQTVARRYKTTMAKVTTIWEATVSALGLPGLMSPKHSSAGEKPPAPAPVRSLSAQEIAKLGYKPPKQIKDRTE